MLEKEVAWEQGYSHELTVVWERCRNSTLPLCWPLLSCIIPSYLVCILFGMPSLHHFTILPFLFSHLGLSLAALHHFISCTSLADMAEGGHPAEESFDSGMFQSKFIHCMHNIYMYVYTWYSTTIDSCHLDEFFVEMDVHKELLNCTHLIFRFMCDRKWLFPISQRFLRLETYR